MSKKTINIFFVLDETGSMDIIKDDTVGGYNQYLSSLKDEKSVNYRFSMMKFDSNHRSIIHDALPIANVPDLTNQTYTPGAATPLYDAVGKAITNMGRKKNVLFIIQTDGLENASKKFTRQEIFDLITEKTKSGWQFAFLGANQDAWEAGADMGIAAGNTSSYDGEQTGEAFVNLAQSSRGYSHNVAMASPGAKMANDSFFKETDLRKSKKSKTPN